MNRPAARETDKRVPVALGIMTLVMALIGSQHVLAGSDPAADRLVALAFAAASSPAP